MSKKLFNFLFWNSVFLFGFSFVGSTYSESEKPLKDDHAVAPKPTPVSESKVSEKTEEQVAQNTSRCQSDEYVILDIKKQKREIEEKQKLVKLKEEEVQSKETALKDQIEKLEALKKEILALSETQGKKNEEKVSKLIETLEKMGPKQAASLINQIDDDLAVLAMFRMSTEKLAKIMNLLEPVKASKLAEQLALGQQAKVRKVASADAMDAPKTEKKGGEKDAN